MASDTQQVLDSIPSLVAERDAAGLVALRDHEDKKVRKAVRKALHGLKSKGVEIPDAPSQHWTAGNVAQDLRAPLRPLATVDGTAVPGALRFMLSIPREVSGALLYVGTLSPDDRVLEFGAYQQTDGQRGRLERDWVRRAESREVPVAWLQGRISWARAQTIARGFSVPRALDEALPRLGEVPSERPTCFLHALPAELAEQPAFDPEKIDELLVAASVQQWPPLLDLEPVLQRAAEIHGDKPQPTEDDERTELMRSALEGQTEIREDLQGAVAAAFEDTAVSRWIVGELQVARAAIDVAKALRESEEAERLPWVPRLLGFQVASLLRAVQQQGGMPGMTQQA